MLDLPSEVKSVFEVKSQKSKVKSELKLISSQAKLIVYLMVRLNR